MRIAKSMFTVLLILTIFSAAFGFKARNFTTHVIYTGSLHSGWCPTKVVGATIIPGVPNVAASTTPVMPCPDNLTIAVVD